MTNNESSQTPTPTTTTTTTNYTKNEPNTSQTKTPPSCDTPQERAQKLFHNSEILAPMVRASTTPLRLLALHYGADTVFTEEIVDRSITNQTERIVNEELGTIDYIRSLESFSPKVRRRMMAASPEGGGGGCWRKNLPVVLRIVPKLERGRLVYQMGSGEPKLALEAAERVYRDVDGIDLNMGCPKKFSVSGGMGAALLKDPARARDIVSTLRRNLPQKTEENGGADACALPISCKIRLLEDTRSTVELVLGLVSAGANAITIHAREAGDESTMGAKWDRLVDVVRELKYNNTMHGVPVVINGDLYTRNDIINLKRKTGADGVMLARPALYNTSIFRKPPTTPSSSNGSSSSSSSETQPTIETNDETRYGYDSPLLLSKTTVVRDYLTFANAYQTHHKNVKYVVCEMMNNRRTPSVLSHCMPQVYPGQQTIDKVCKCKSMEDLCRLWDVSMSGAVGGAHSPTTVVKNDDGGGAVDTALVHRYDDRYFLDPEGLRKVREREEEEGGKGMTGSEVKRTKLDTE